MMGLLASGDEYVAMGSSYAAGPGLKPRAMRSPIGSGRSAANYAHRFAERRKLRLIDVTFSGAVSDDLLLGGKHGAQLDAVTRNTRLVTITAGGNDIGYLPALTLGSLPSPIRRLPWASRQIEAAVDRANLEARLGHLEHQLTRLVSQIRSRAPHAEIVLVDYLTILPPLGHRAPPLGGGIEAWGRQAAGRLSELYSVVADERGCRFVPAGSRSLEHHAWSVDPWTKGFHLSLRKGAPYHPNAEGMRQVALMLGELPI